MSLIDDLPFALKKAAQQAKEVKQSICSSVRRNISDYCENETTCAISNTEANKLYQEIAELRLAVEKLEQQMQHR